MSSAHEVRQGSIRAVKGEAQAWVQDLHARKHPLVTFGALLQLLQGPSKYWLSLICLSRFHAPHSCCTTACFLTHAPSILLQQVHADNPVGLFDILAPTFGEVALQQKRQPAPGRG